MQHDVPTQDERRDHGQRGARHEKDFTVYAFHIQHPHATVPPEPPSTTSFSITAIGIATDNTIHVSIRHWESLQLFVTKAAGALIPAGPVGQ